MLPHNIELTDYCDVASAYVYVVYVLQVAYTSNTTNSLAVTSTKLLNAEPG